MERMGTGTGQTLPSSTCQSSVQQTDNPTAATTKEKKTCGGSVAACVYRVACVICHVSSVRVSSACVAVQESESRGL
jgi:hypothetical protein